MFVKRKTYNKVKKERDEALARIKEYEKKAWTYHQQSNFFFNKKEEVKSMTDQAKNLYNQLGDFFAQIADYKQVVATAPVETNKEALKKLAQKLKEIPDGARGTGGIDIIKDGKIETKNFSTKKELEDIYEDVKKGKITLAQQAW